MGTWGTGPFDNDTAADWLATLDEADPAERVEMIRETFHSVLAEKGYLDGDIAMEAIAAAAVLAANETATALPGTSYGPGLLPVGDPGELTLGAVRALDRILGDDSEWRELWEESDLHAEAVSVVTGLRSALDRPSPTDGHD